jgi:hypothetical protein
MKMAGLDVTFLNGGRLNFDMLQAKFRDFLLALDRILESGIVALVRKFITESLNKSLSQDYIGTPILASYLPFIN